jgi:hypothetical protein
VASLTKTVHQIRTLLGDPDMRLESSTVEIDKTYSVPFESIGLDAYAGRQKKTPTRATVEREGRVS